MGKLSLALHLFCCDVSDEGAMALAAALPAAGQGCHVTAWFNRIGLAGQAALLEALEAKHGPQAQLGHTMAVQQVRLQGIQVTHAPCPRLTPGWSLKARTPSLF